MNTTSASKNLNGQVAIVTGSSRGIGLACAKILFENGAKVVLVSRSMKDLISAKTEILKTSSCKDRTINPNSILCIEADVTLETEVHKIFKQTILIFGPINILVNNAGKIILKNFMDHTFNDWNSVLQTNLHSAFLCSQAAFDQMIKSKIQGTIINVSSLGGIKSTEKFKGTTSYVAAKSALVGLTEALAVEGKEYGIRVNCIAPGAVNTQMLKMAAPHLKTSAGPEDLAEVFLFLADRSKSKVLTGTVIEVHSNE